MKHQEEVLESTKSKNRVAYYLDMGLGKTFVGSEKALSLGKNILVVCQKSKVEDWVNHFIDNYTNTVVSDCTTKKGLTEFFRGIWYMEEGILNEFKIVVGVINYDLIWRRPELSQLRDFTLILDESSLIQNEATKRSKFILKSLFPSNVILLSGTCTNGKYERLWSQCRLLGWNISKTEFYRRYCIEEPLIKWNGQPMKNCYGGIIKQVTGYKNVDELKEELRNHGAVFMKTEEVIDLPEQTFIDITVPETKDFIKFKKDKIVTVEDTTLVGDTNLTSLLYQRMLSSQYNKNKLNSFEDLVNSTNDRLVVFYNFTEELNRLKELVGDRPISIINGSNRDLTNYENCDDCITFVQYQAGSMGINLQKANKIIYFSPTQSCEMYMQSLKRVHRIGQKNTCFYYLMKSGIDYHIYDAIQRGVDYTERLFAKTFS